MAGSGSTLWPALTAGGRARASDIEFKFDWCEANLLPMLSGATTDIVYDLGSETRRWRYAWIGSAISPTTSASAIAIGTTTANANTILDLAGTRAFMLPRLSTAQRDILTAADGMLLYNSTTGRFNGRASGTWQDFASPIRVNTAVSLTIQDGDPATTVAMTINDTTKAFANIILETPATTTINYGLRIEPTTTGFRVAYGTAGAGGVQSVSLTVRFIELF